MAVILALWKLGQNGLDHRVLLCLGLKGQFSSIAHRRNRFATTIVHNGHSPTVARPLLQLGPQALRQVTRRGFGRDKFDAAGLIRGQLQRTFHFNQQFHVAV